jgi:hypothetical protein
MQAIKRARIKSHQRKALRDGTFEASSTLSLLDFMDIAAHRDKVETERLSAVRCTIPFQGGEQRS